MKISKGETELSDYGKKFGTMFIIPLSIEADEETCEVHFYMYNDQGFKRSLIRKGKHENFIFRTSVYNLPFQINLKTNVLSRIVK